MKTVALPEAAKIIMGQSPPSSSYNTVGDGLPFFQGKADFGDLYPTVRMFCTEPSKIAEPGDVLISVRAPVGPTNISPQKSCIGRGLAAIRAKKHTDTRYLLYFLRFYEPELAEQGKGSTFSAISRIDLESVHLPLPPFPEQQRIAAVLSKADRLRRLRRTARELSDTYLPSVFLEMFGDPMSNPRGWDTGKLHKLCSQVVDCPHSTPVYASTTTPYACIRSSDIQSGFLDWSTTKYVEFDVYQERTERAVPMLGDVVYCREGARFGNAARVPKDKKVCLGQRMMLFRANPKAATPEFIWAFLEAKRTYQQIVDLAGGSASPHVNVRDIKALTAIVPSLPLQHQFVAIVHKFERLCAQQREAERQAEHLFQVLLERAFTGAGLEREG